MIALTMLVITKAQLMPAILEDSLEEFKKTEKNDKLYGSRDKKILLFYNRAIATPDKKIYLYLLCLASQTPIPSSHIA
ncbi:hypothetical protein [Candidatus Tisiphia endosymbiont of Beris chalybata]|uniref:hypothetical protein n=1 Tax=Candidatus Tisiphia endosymbiont of Beris chalybata TaxID=3066262 RepID=UPI00312C9447